jgi:hypothetical protein
MISSAEWAQFSNDLNVFNSEVGNQQVTWKHITVNLPRYGEGEPPTYDTRTIQCVVSYNAFRVWPISKETDAGTIDKEYCYLLMNNTILLANGWMTAEGNFKYNPNGDIFIVDGIEHEPSGDTPVSPNNTSPLYTILILKRKTVNTPFIEHP